MAHIQKQTKDGKFPHTAPGKVVRKTAAPKKTKAPAAKAPKPAKMSAYARPILAHMAAMATD